MDSAVVASTGCRVLQVSAECRVVTRGDYFLLLNVDHSIVDKARAGAENVKGVRTRKWKGGERFVSGSIGANIPCRHRITQILRFRFKLIHRARMLPSLDVTWE